MNARQLPLSFDKTCKTCKHFDRPTIYDHYGWCKIRRVGHSMDFPQGLAASVSVSHGCEKWSPK